MRKIFFVALVLAQLVSSEGRAVTAAHLSMPASRDYMARVAARYEAWHRERYGTRFSAAPRAAVERSLVSRALAELTHWKVPQSTLNQLEVMHAVRAGKLHVRYRVYLAPSLRQELRSKGDIWFLEWDEDGEFCSWAYQGAQRWRASCKLATGPTWLVVPSAAAPIPAAVTDPFAAISRPLWQLQRGERVLATAYEAPLTHLSRVPGELWPLIRQHGEALLLPFDKYVLSAAAEMQVLYP